MNQNNWALLYDYLQSIVNQQFYFCHTFLKKGFYKFQLKKYRESKLESESISHVEWQWMNPLHALSLSLLILLHKFLFKEYMEPKLKSESISC